MSGGGGEISEEKKDIRQSPKRLNNMEGELLEVKNPLEKVDSRFRAGYHLPGDGLSHFGLLYISE